MTGIAWRGTTLIDGTGTKSRRCVQSATAAVVQPLDNGCSSMDGPVFSKSKNRVNADWLETLESCSTTQVRNLLKKGRQAGLFARSRVVFGATYLGNALTTSRW